MGKLNYLVQRALNMNYKAMLDKINSIHKKTGTGRLAIFRDMKDCAVKYGAGYMDYDLFEMYNLTAQQRDTYLTRGRNNALVAKYNAKDHMADLGDKIKFNTRFAPFLHRDWVPVTGENREDVLAFLSRHDTFMAKPSQGSCGWGIEKLHTSDFPSLDDLYNHLKERAPLLELEEVIVQHPAVAAIYPGSINTVRMVTIRGKSGRVYLVTAMFRIGNGKFVDNFNSGGMVAPMDPEAGTVIDRALDKQKNLYENHPRHPHQGVPLSRLGQGPGPGGTGRPGHPGGGVCGLGRVLHPGWALSGGGQPVPRPRHLSAAGTHPGQDRHHAPVPGHRGTGEEAGKTACLKNCPRLMDEPGAVFCLTAFRPFSQGYCFSPST